MENWSLEVYSWSGYSIGAIHYYADLTNYEKKIFLRRIERPLTQRMAENINKRLKFTYAEEYYNLYKVHQGEMDYRFDDKESATLAGIEKFMELADYGDILVDYDDKMKVLANK